MSRAQVLSVDQMRAAEQALAGRCISESELMERAGKGCADWIWRVAAGRDVTVLCGPGNNGGDGYVIARKLAKRGTNVSVIAPLPSKTGTGQKAAQLYNGPVETSCMGDLSGVFVDCLFGSGLARDLKAEHALLLRDLAERHDYSIAIDVPSGIESDSGAILSDAPLQYDLTLALGAWKYAHFRLPALTVMGEQRLVPIGIEPVQGAARLVERPKISVPAFDAHKYTRGLAAIVAGAMPGAALLACASAQRAGAGYTKLLGKIGNRPVSPSLVTSGKPLDEALDDPRIAAILIGPGLGRDERAQDKLATSLRMANRAVLDADALHLLGPSMLNAEAEYLATPHDGELEALCQSFGIDAADRCNRALALAKVCGMTIIAKGPDTFIATPDGRLRMARPASSWLSVAGTGDVLAGIAVSRMATGLSALDAACEAVWLHSEAARLTGAAFTADALAERVSDAMENAQ